MIESTCNNPSNASVETTAIEETTKLSIAECQVETQKHIENVRRYVRFMIDKLDIRGVKHDYSKLESPEVELFAEHTNQLAGMTYGSEEYHESLEQLKPALEHHYASNRHHPEHFLDGINDMTLIDIAESLKIPLKKLFEFKD